MKSEALKVSAVVPAEPAEVFSAWLNSKAHTEFTGGGRATASPRVGGAFTAWDGYIRGRNLELVPGRRIVQSWRSTEFPEDVGDSRLEVTLARTAQGTRVTLKHSKIPAGQAKQYETGWVDYYLAPMKTYFARRPKKAAVSKTRRPPVSRNRRKTAKAK
ncbi:MAG: SRPBCC domain-containing protein [Myxococcaceae bacterium]